MADALVSRRAALTGLPGTALLAGVGGNGPAQATAAPLTPEAGAAAIIVSNHGAARPTAPRPASGPCRPSCGPWGGRVPVLFDSGVRRGIDAVRALALGATAVGIEKAVFLSDF